MDRAAYVTLDSTYNNLKTVMEEVEGAKEENISKCVRLSLRLRRPWTLGTAPADLCCTLP